MGGYAFSNAFMDPSVLSYHEVSVQGNMFDKYDSNVLHFLNSFLVKNHNTLKVSLYDSSFLIP